MTLAHVQALAQAAPQLFEEQVKVDWEAFEQGLQQAGFSPATVLAATWCKFGKINIEALVDSVQLGVLSQDGFYASAGKRKMFGGAVKFDSINFSQCRGFGPVEHTDERGLGKFGIEFVGPGNVLLGRPYWSWRAKRLKDPRERIMAAAEERDRVLDIVKHLSG